MSPLLLIFIIPVGLWIISGLRVIQEYEAGVIFRLGRYAETKRAGLNWIVPGLDRMVKVDLRTVTRDVPAQDVITHDNVSLKVSAVTLMRYTSFERSSGVCTLRGVNSAFGEMNVIVPFSRCPASVRIVADCPILSCGSVNPST